MKQLNKPSDNMGGLLKIWAVPPSVITIVNNTVSFSTTDAIVEMYCSPGSMVPDIKENTKGRYKLVFETNISGFIPKNTPETQSIIKDMIGPSWVVIYLDANEQWNVAGTPERPLHFTLDFSTGSDTADRNGYNISFYGVQVDLPSIVEDPWA